MSSKIVVKHFHSHIKRGGGPPGYLYCLSHAIQSVPEDMPVRFEIFPFAREEQAGSFPAKVRHRLRQVALNQRIHRTYHSLSDAQRQYVKFVQAWAQGPVWMEPKHCRQLLDCDLLFVHDTFTAQRIAALYPAEAQRKVILMTHSPTFIGHQAASDFMPDADTESLYAEPYVREVVQREMDAMQSLRAVAWPCAEAQEGYPDWYQLYRHGTVNSVFVETGVLEPSPQSSPQGLRDQWGVRPEQKLALFIGRAHPHKGFDRFVDWADQAALRDRDQWVFAYAGAKPNTNRALDSIRQVGYQTDNAACYQAADLVVLPNRYSYFDIGVLEALSLGARLAISPTGGHRYLANQCPSLPTIPDTDPAATWQCLKKISAEYAHDASKQAELRRYWQERFSPAPFLRNHVALAQQLICQ